MRDHHHGQLLRQLPVGQQVFFPKFGQGFVDDGSGVVRVHLAAAQARESAFRNPAPSAAPGRGESAWHSG